MLAKRLLLALVLVVSALAVPVAADGMAAIDADHGLTERETIETYQSEDVASTTVEAPAMNITVAEDHDDVGLEGFRLDYDKRYLRVQYNESISRTVRFYVPSEYWYPITSEIEAVDEDVTAEMQPTEDGRHTAVTMTFDEQTDAVFEVPKEANLVFWGRSKSREVVNNTTGYEPPHLGEDEEWQYIPEGQLENESTYPVETDEDGDITLQYDTNSTAGVEEWRMVPECSGNDDPVCYYEKAGVDGEVFVLAKTADPPTVRFKQGTDASAKVESSGRELWDIPDKIMDDLNGLLNGGESDDD
ncbi:MAG: hypothetical protein ACOCQY_05085 [Halorhabdus sp.]